MDVGYECKMDNLFNSMNCACEAYNLAQKVKNHGVISH